MSEKSTKTDTPDRGRFSARRKAAAVVRMLRGEDLESLSRELGVTAATLSSWRQSFLDGGTAAMKSRPADDRDELVARLQANTTAGTAIRATAPAMKPSGRWRATCPPAPRRRSAWPA